MATAIATCEALIVRKSFAGIELKADQEGSFSATIASFSIVDKDAEVTLPGAMPEGKRINISAYGHSSWGGFSAAELPVGSAVIHQDQQRAWVEGRFWLDTELGKQHYLALKNQLADGAASEWSYGFQVLRSSTDDAQLAKWPGAVRILEELDVFEASPVLRGAGENTGTDLLKSAVTLAQRGEKLAADTSEFLVHAHAAVSMRAKEGRILSQANADRVTSVADALEEAAGVLRKLLADAKPAMTEQQCDDAGGTWDPDTGMCEMPMNDDGKAALQRQIRDAHLGLIHRGMTAA